MRAVANREWKHEGWSRIGDTSVETVREGLFTSGELHSMEGLAPRA